MKIRDVKPGMSNISLTARVLSISEPRRVETKYGEAMVASAIIADETGEIVLNLWRNQISLVKPGYLIRVENAFAKEYKGKLELSIGKQGKITVLSKSDGSVDSGSLTQ